MLKLIPFIKKSLIGSIALFLVLFFPAGIAFADGTTPAICTPPPATSPGVHWPTGSDAGAFTYQCSGQYAGMWTSAHYVYNPATGQYSPLDPVVYTYNNQTSKWDATIWVYDAAQGKYVATTKSVITPPPGAATVGGPPAPTPTDTPTTLAPTTPSPTTTSGAGSDPNTNASLAPATNPTTGSGINTSLNSTATQNNTTNAGLTNTLTGQAGSGNAAVTSNTSGGSASSGNAQDIANVINSLQSSASMLDPSGNLITFTANINGDVNGDLLLDPATLSTIQPASSSTTLNNNVIVNNSTNESINNNIDVGAASGNAKVTNNTSAGNATTGNAAAVANIVNILNSAISSGKSFFGVININGNLNGDILLPPNFVDQLLAANVPHTTISTNQLNQKVSVTNNTNQAIDNAITASANTGSATVGNNTAGGNATSGTATTDLTVFNLTGSNVIGANSLLVFVNVLGQWVGLIMNAPAGSTAAELGGGIVTNTINNNANISNTTNQTINNNINVAAQSGDAAVTSNTKGGNATSGNATASVNLLNLINDNLSFSNWFGLLFINVFGTWHGSFGINTAAGNPVIPTAPAIFAPTSSAAKPAVKMFQFVPSTNKTVSFTPYDSGTVEAAAAVTPPTNTQNAVLAAQTVTPGSHTPQKFTTDQAHHNYWVPIAGVILSALILAAERIQSRRSQA